MATRGGESPLEVRDDNGKLRRLAPLGLCDFDVLAQDIRASRLASLKEYLKDLDTDERVQQVQALIATPIGIAEILQECGTPDRALRILHLSLRKDEPGLTLERVRDSFGQQTVPQILDLIIVLSGLVGSEEPEGADPPEASTGTPSLPTSSNTSENATPPSAVGASAKS